MRNWRDRPRRFRVLRGCSGRRMDIPDTFSSIICGKEYHGGCDPRVIPPFFVSTRRSGARMRRGLLFIFAVFQPHRRVVHQGIQGIELADMFEFQALQHIIQRRQVRFGLVKLAQIVNRQ